MITIALPAHNEEKSIYGTLKTIASSNFFNDEFCIHVCLSACTDNTLAEVDKFKSENTNVHIFTHVDTKGGKVRALKLLDYKIENDLIIFMDSDCRPRPTTLSKLYFDLKNAALSVPVYSGNSIDVRYSDKNIPSKNLLESFNRVFWQHPARKIINGQLFCARKGVVQVLQDEVILDDPYLSIVHWDNFMKDNDALIDQGSPQSIWDIIRYQKSIEAGKVQLKVLLGSIPNFSKITKEMYSQFDIKYSDRKSYYPNISFMHLTLIKLLTGMGRLWGKISKPIWHQTLSSKL